MELRKCFVLTPIALLLGLAGLPAAGAETPRKAVGDDVEEVVVTEERIAPEDFNPVLMQRVRDSNGRGARLYRQGRYRDAFPYLLAAAKRGFKLAQARVGYIYQEGLGGVNRDAFAAIGWIGAAATHDTTPEIRAHFKAMLAAVPAPFKPQAEAIVADYRSRYSGDAVGMSCENRRLAGTHISRLKCVFDNEFDFRDGVDAALMGDLFTPATIPPPEQN